MMNTLQMINTTVAKGNAEDKQVLMLKNAYYLKSFIRNNRENEYQEYVISLEEVEQEMPCLETV